MTIEVGSGGASTLPQLAPDLTFPRRLVNNNNYNIVTINPQGALTTALSLTGKYSISMLAFTNLTQELITIKLTSDGVVIWNDTYSVTDGEAYLLGRNSVNNESIECKNSLLLEIETLSDTLVALYYLVRPIL